MIYPADSAIHRLNNWGQIMSYSFAVLHCLLVILPQFSLFSTLLPTYWAVFTTPAPKHQMAIANSGLCIPFVFHQFKTLVVGKEYPEEKDSSFTFSLPPIFRWWRVLVHLLTGKRSFLGALWCRGANWLSATLSSKLSLHGKVFGVGF